MPWRYLGRLAAVLVVFLLAGCGGSSTVTGEVTLDGKAIEEGLITFVPGGGKSPNVVVKIKDGKYSAKVPPGPVTVQVSATKVTGKRRMYETPDSPMVDVYEERIPKKYNTSSELKTEIKSGSNTLNWELKSE
jgi:hypothetical protein